MAIMLVAFVAAGMSFLLLNTFGPGCSVTVGAVLLVGFIAMITGASLSYLSDKGAQLAAAFEPFRRFLKDVSKGKMGLPDPAYYEAYLPYATAYGLAESG